MIRSSLTTKRVAGAALAVALGTGLGLGAISMWSAQGATTAQAYRVDSGFPSTPSGGPESPAGSSSAPAPADAPAPAAVDSSDGMTTIEKAASIALAFAPGRVVEVDQDQDFPTGLRYDVTILHDNGTSTDVEVDAESGQIVSTDVDNDSD